MENSHTTSRPPGLVTRRSSVRAAAVSETLRSPKEMVTASKLSSAYGSWSPSPATKASQGLRRLPTVSMPSEMSVGTTNAPAAANGSLDVPVPAARSRTRSPTCGSTASSTSLRQARS